jgi:hypothetical protein
MGCFTPKSDSELNSERLLPKGEYDFEVSKAIDKTFKSGSIGIALTVTVFQPDGTCRLVNDNLVFTDAAMFKVSQFSKCVGLYEKYSQGEINAIDCERRSGRCKVDIEPEGEFPAKNVIKGYVVPKVKPQAQSPDSIAKEQESNPDWDITP